MLDSIYRCKITLEHFDWPFGLGWIIVLAILAFVSHGVYARFYMWWLDNSVRAYHRAAHRRLVVLIIGLIIFMAMGLIEQLEYLCHESIWTLAMLFIIFLGVWELVYYWVFLDEDQNLEALRKPKEK